MTDPTVDSDCTKASKPEEAVHTADYKIAVPKTSKVKPLPKSAKKPRRLRRR